MQLIPCLLFHSFGNNGMVATADAGGFSSGLFNHKYLQGNEGSNGVWQLNTLYAFLLILSITFLSIPRIIQCTIINFLIQNWDFEKWLRSLLIALASWQTFIWYNFVTLPSYPAACLEYNLCGTPKWDFNLEILLNNTESANLSIQDMY